MPRAHFGPGPAVLAFDVGGTDVKSALVDASGQVLGVRRTPAPVHGENPAGRLAEALAHLQADYLATYPTVHPVAAGVSVPGIVDETTGVGILAGNMGWRDAPVRDLVGTALGLPIAFGHDVRSAGAAEFALGAAREYENVVVLAIGTGIAGAIIIDGKPYSAHGYAGEFGHALSDPNGDPCPCGAVGCLETIASAGAIARRYGAATGTVVRGARVVLEAAQAGDDVAQRVWNDAVDALAAALARTAAILAPEAIVIAGGLSEAGDALFVPLQARLEQLLSFHRRPKLLRAQLGDDAGLLGTALAARRALVR
ncbi:MAG TPA: ROK family protein [Candidatus Lumbricidophila sp.]|nr:ROK family protein [Candidatus Lumbricidophila sp.]